MTRLHLPGYDPVTSHWPVADATQDLAKAAPAPAPLSELQRKLAKRMAVEEEVAVGQVYPEGLLQHQDVGQANSILFSGFSI